MAKTALNIPFTVEGIENYYQNIKMILSLADKWSIPKDDLLLFLKGLKAIDDIKVGSPIFKYFWTSLSLQAPLKALEFVLEQAKMPTELSGELSETQYLVAQFSDELAPHDDFWIALSQVIYDSFPGNSLAEDTVLNRKLHQFRYLISSQQAQYVRRYFKDVGMTDRDALVNYLSCLREPDNIAYYESARLHNKRRRNGEIFAFPDDETVINSKLLISFHTEFIIDDKGNFLNEIDAEVITSNGIINGASFNYAFKNNTRHKELDVDPVKLDPKFRNDMTRGYRSPNLSRRKWFFFKEEDYDCSYFNKKGYYAFGRRSAKQSVDKQVKYLKKAVQKMCLN
ncbi:TPA: DUF3114 domain-containing protein [Streptococcus agalactiae]